ncbi:hypothetical protein CC1G_03491 [Coprinopsis cinerea okayama7|uniref:Uncharacterized protein n=1 Tax=Coprinopsis cinerea (strain Okayama-7 / 130 / ATCC MYA-4618 / FGSC 9003) TaxID=240176 RepID=A8NCD3_COPC7|nr:hypothetical protein CC1G_03491 [Coprinopsis cinerea okayama7\|eukprot:XP_001832477.2 hypothetical protein CC1G_03491 [Coprinopsis cinerea okayama7\
MPPLQLPGTTVDTWPRLDDLPIPGTIPDLELSESELDALFAICTRSLIVTQTGISTGTASPPTMGREQEVDG